MRSRRRTGDSLRRPERSRTGVSRSRTRCRPRSRSRAAPPIRRASSCPRTTALGVDQPAHVLVPLAALRRQQLLGHRRRDRRHVHACGRGRGQHRPPGRHRDARPTAPRPARPRATPSIAASAPSNISPRRSAVTFVIGATLTAETGTWVGTNLVYTYQWQRCDAERRRLRGHRGRDREGLSPDVGRGREDAEGRRHRIELAQDRAPRTSNASPAVPATSQRTRPCPTIARRSGRPARSPPTAPTTGTWTGAGTMTTGTSGSGATPPAATARTSPARPRPSTRPRRRTSAGGCASSSRPRTRSARRARPPSRRRSSPARRR